MSQKRCAWVENTFPLYIQYHDEEWGVPVFDDQKHFEFLVLESAQAGLSWATILKKREGYRSAFAGFDVNRVANFSGSDVNKLLQNEEIIKNSRKIEAAINNARKIIGIQEKFGSFSDYIWQFVDGKPIINQWKNLGEVPAKTSISDALAKDLKSRGFKFLGSTTLYAHMQACGLVMDHTTDCFRYPQLS